MREPPVRMHSLLVCTKNGEHLAPHRAGSVPTYLTAGWRAIHQSYEFGGPGFEGKGPELIQGLAVTLIS